MEALRRHPRNFLVVLGARLAENGLGYLFPVFGLSYVDHHARRAQGRRAQRADARLRHRAVHHHRLRGALRPDRTTAGLHVRRTQRHRSGVSVLLAGRHQGVDLDRGGLHRGARRRDGGNVRAAGRVFRRTVPTAAAFRRLRLRARTGLAARRRSGAVRGQRRWWHGREAGGRSRATRSSSSACTAIAIWCRSRDLSRRASPSTTPRMADRTRRQPRCHREPDPRRKTMAQQLRILQSLWAMERRRAGRSGVAAADAA